MCKFCENFAVVKTEFPKETKYGELDSSDVMMLKEGVLRIENRLGRGYKNELPIFQIDILFCPYCGRKIKDVTSMTKYNHDVITSLGGVN